MKKDIAVSLQNISKVYKLYDKPIDRLKEALNPFKKKYNKDFYALKNINLEIKKGEVLGIVGVNGAGKSTLLKIISGVLTPSSGRVNINGRINAILELGSSLKPEMTGRENIKLNLQINGIDEDRDKITKEIIEFADIGEHIDQPIKSYSSGMKARLGFAIATSTDPDVLIVDEVLAVGDVLFQRKCYSKIEKLFKDGKTVIFVSHNAQSVVEFCSRAVLLYDREIIMDDTPKKVTDYYQKLLFSKDKKKVLDEINIKVEIGKQKLNKEVKKKMEVDQEFYSNTLRATPITIVDKNLVRINEIYILNENNLKVNILKTNHNYTLVYKVECKEECHNLIFGGLFKTIKGLGLSGININNNSFCIQKLTRGNSYFVKIKFKCFFLDSVYLFNIGILEKSNKEFIYRVFDALIFKVDNQADNTLMGGGIVNLINHIEFEKET